MWTGNGRWYGAYNFDGIDDGIYIANDSSFNNLQTFTISARIKSNSNQEQGIISLPAGG
jgi:hypothetical protein